jgi:hypothetical protein
MTRFERSVLVCTLESAVHPEQVLVEVDVLPAQAQGFALS